MTSTQKLAIVFIKVSRQMKRLSYPLLHSVFGTVSVCHHTPSCSEYTIQQIQQHGTIRGLYKGVLRVSHCY